MKKISSFVLAIVLVLNSAAFAGGDSYDNQAQWLNQKAEDFKESGLSLMKIRSDISQKGYAEISTVFLKNLENQPEYVNLRNVLLIKSLKHFGAKSVRITPENKDVTLAQLDGAITKSFENFASHKVAFVKLLKKSGNPLTVDILKKEEEDLRAEIVRLQGIFDHYKNVERSFGGVSVVLMVLAVVLLATGQIYAAPVAIIAALGSAHLADVYGAQYLNDLQKQIDLASEALVIVINTSPEVTVESPL